MVFAGQLRGHPRVKEIQTVVTAAQKTPEYRKALMAFPVFAKRFRSFFTGGPVLKPDAVPILEQIKPMVPAKSTVGMMTEEFLLLRPKENSPGQARNKRR